MLQACHDSLLLQTAFYLPTDTNRLVHISNTTTTKEVWKGEEGEGVATRFNRGKVW